MWTLNSKILLTTASTLLISAHAQNATNSTRNETNCSDQALLLNSGNATVNSTGLKQWTWEMMNEENNKYTEPWYVSLLINDTTRGKDDGKKKYNGGVTANTFVSAPANLPNGTRICAYQFGSINATLDDPQPGKHSCKGAISDGCIEYLSKNWHLSGRKNANDCPEYHDGTEDGIKAFEDACPELNNGVNNRFSHYKSLTNLTCPISRLPSIPDIPKTYNTLTIPSQLTPYADPAYEEHGSMEQAYDLMTRQVVPIVLKADLMGRSDMSWQASTEFLCVVGNQSVEGSRVVEGEVPWSGAGMMRGGWEMVVVVAGVVGMISMV